MEVHKLDQVTAEEKRGKMPGDGYVWIVPWSTSKSSWDGEDSGHLGQREADTGRDLWKQMCWEDINDFKNKIRDAEVT